MGNINAVPDKASGDILTETDWDQSIRDNVNDGIVTKRACRIYNGSNVNTTTTLAAVPFDSERFDNDNMHDTSGAVSNTRITIVTGGVYAFVGHVDWEPDTGRINLQIRLNGTDTIGAVSQLGTGTVNTRQFVFAIYQCVVSDYVELMVSSVNSVRIDNSAKFSPEFAACRF